MVLKVSAFLWLEKKIESPTIRAGVGGQGMAMRSSKLENAYGD